MAFQDNTLRNKLQMRIISGVTGSTQFNTYKGKPEEEYEYMGNAEGMGNTEGMAIMGCAGCQQHVAGCPFMQRRRRVNYQLCKTYGCVKTNRMVGMLNLILLVIFLVT